MRNTLEYMIGSRVRCAGEDCGEVEFVVVDPVGDKLTHLVVRPDFGDLQARLVPMHLAVPGSDGVELNCTRARLEQCEPAEQTHFLPGAERPGPGRGDRVLAWPYFGHAPSPAVGGVAPGAEAPLESQTATVEHIPAGEVGIRRGERVHAVDGQIGRVKGLAVVAPDSLVTHLLLDEGHLWGRKRVAIPIGDVTGIGGDGVAVRLSKAEIKDLPPVDTGNR